MKATQIRALLVAPALAALAIGAHMASGDTVTPSGTFTASLSSGTKVSIKLGTVTVTCTGSTTGGTVPAPTGAGAPVCGSVSAPTLTGCTVLGANATCTAAGSWNLCVTPTTATLTGGTVDCSATILGQHCTANSGAVNFSGSWSNASSSASFSNQTVSVTTGGGFGCPSGTSATFSASYTTSPALTVTNP